MRGFFKYGIFAIILVATIALWRVGPVHAQMPPQMGVCGQVGAAPYRLSLHIPKGTYNAYVNLPHTKGSTAHLYRSDSTNACQPVGNAQIRPGHWQHMGTIHMTNTGDQAFTILVGTPAFSPELLLVPQSNPPCRPDKACTVYVNGQSGTLQLPYSTSTMAQARGAVVLPPSSQKIQSVAYFVDDHQAYTSKSFDAFAMQFVGAGTHTLKRVITYASGQRVVFRGSAAVSARSAMWHVLQRIFYGVLLTAHILAWVCLGLLALVYAGRWLVGLYRRSVRLPGIIGVFCKLAIPWAAVLVAVVWATQLSSNYLLRTMQVDGMSMSRTLHDGQRIGIDRAGITLAGITGRQYLPKRGEIVVFRATGDPADLRIKRVIGMPGDRVVIRGGHLMVFNQTHPKGFDPDANQRWSTALLPGLSHDLDTTIGPGELFVSGDNRGGSLDSRWHGSIALDSVVGKAVVSLGPVRGL